MDRLIDLPLGWKEPDQTFVIAASPRSGSSYLARLIDTTGLFKCTEEYFEPKVLTRAGGSPDDDLTTRLAQIDRMSRTERNLLSIKLFPRHMIEILQHRLMDRAFCSARYVFLRRQDALGQAMSFVRATMTERWFATEQEPSPKALYDRQAIAEAVRLLASYNSWWDIYFATRHVPVLHLTYEDLEADPAATAARIVSFLGFDPAEFPADPSKIRLQKQRDEVTEEWRRRFLASEHAVPTPWDGRPKARTLRNAVRFLRGTL